jgi:hypothetical protein
MAVVPMWHGGTSSAKGRATPVVLMASVRNARFKADFLSFCRDNAAVLNLADARLSPSVAPMRLFYGHGGVHAGPGRSGLCSQRGGAASMAKEAGSFRVRRATGLAAAGRPMAVDVIIQHCLAQMDFLCYLELTEVESGSTRGEGNREAKNFLALIAMPVGMVRFRSRL